MYYAICKINFLFSAPIVIRLIICNGKIKCSPHLMIYEGLGKSKEIIFFFFFEKAYIFFHEDRPRIFSFGRIKYKDSITDTEQILLNLLCSLI